MLDKIATLTPKPRSKLEKASEKDEHKGIRSAVIAQGDDLTVIQSQFGTDYNVKPQVTWTMLGQIHTLRGGMQVLLRWGHAAAAARRGCHGLHLHVDVYRPPIWPPPAPCAWSHRCGRGRNGGCGASRGWRARQVHPDIED